MKLKPTTKHRQNFLISFQYFLYYNKLYKWSISKTTLQSIGWLCYRKCR